ncbi:MAG: DUF1513 domain-containing protein [Comamonadaceae bacterium]|nr:MAG: DUF1513 domain-containing protein [Comamonadaceae bacterium]
MPENLNLARRQWLVFAASTVASAHLPALAADARGPQFAAAWESAAGYQVGILAAGASALDVRSALDVPTRAHGVLVERSGTVLAVARRPGDWLLRWKPEAGRGAKALQWSWADPDRVFNGHVIASADGKLLYTTETDLETGQGLIGVRNAATLEKIAQWPTGGMDPHELLLDADGSLVVANGGIPAMPETGRIKIHLDRMDASLVRMDTKKGALLGQWRLADKRLSMRHMAWGPVDTTTGRRLLGLALQGEHDDPALKANAPVFARFDGRELHVHAAPEGQALSGYGGDVTWAAGGFAVSCPRSNGVARWRADGQWIGFNTLEEACALASVEKIPQKNRRQTIDVAEQPSTLWTGGRFNATADDGRSAAQSKTVKNLRIDNHWMPLAG